MRILKFLILLIMTVGCATRSINYDRNKIVKKYSANFSINIDNEKVVFENIYLDKDNIKKVRVNKKTKELSISQIKKTELFELKNLNLDSLSAGRRSCWYQKKIVLIVLNGIPLTDSLKNKIKIDTNAIKSVEIFSQERLNSTTFCSSIDGDFLLITTK